MFFKVEDSYGSINELVNIFLNGVIWCMIAVAIVCLIILLYFVLRRYSMKNFEYKRYFSEKGAFEGQEIYLIEEFTNHSFLPAFKVDVETHITTKLNIPGCHSGNEINQEFVSRFFVMPFTKIRRKHRVICEKRGVYTLESAKIYFMKIEVFLDSVAEIKVYPKELTIDEINRINSCTNISSISVRPMLRDPFSFAGIREYHHGDGMNMINHKATARFGSLMVNETDFAIGRKILLYLNFQGGNTGISIREFQKIMELAMEYAAYFAGEAMRNGWQFGLSANCRMENNDYYFRAKIGTGYGKYMEILDGLALARNIYGNSIGFIMNMDLDASISDTEIFILTTYVDESISNYIESFQRLGNTVNIVDLKEAAAYEQ